MNNIVQVFDFNSQHIRFVDGFPVANDVAEILGYKDPVNTVRKKVSAQNKGVAKMATPGGTQSVVVLREAGIYQLIFSSKLDYAEKFQQWVFEEVLPSIHKTGSYKSKKGQSHGTQFRLEGKDARRELTDAVKDYIGRHQDELSPNAIKWMYSNMTNGLYLKTHQLKASQLVQIHGCKKEELRDHFSTKEISMITAVEFTAMQLIDINDINPIEAIKSAVERVCATHLFASKYMEEALKLKAAKD